MWSLTDLTRAVARPLLICVTLLFVSACGYGFGADGPNIFEPVTPGALPSLKVKMVDNPTLFPWVSYTLRSDIRDEIGARKLARWVDSGMADYELTLKIHQFTIRSWITDKDDATSLYNANIVVEAIVFRGDTNQQVWSSGQVGYSQAFENIDERSVGATLTREISRRIASRMQQAF